jgi:hypothetical protein
MLLYLLWQQLAAKGGRMVSIGVAENMVSGIRQRIFAHFLKE